MSRSASPAAARRLATTAAPVFAALGDETRLRLVTRLGSGPQSTRQLTDTTALTRQAVTKHLEALAGAGLVSDTRAGRERIWQLESAGIRGAQRYLDLVSQQWDDALTRLADHLGAGPE